MDARGAGPDDVGAVAATLAGAFGADPAWSWVFPDPVRREEQLTEVWTLLVEGALGYGWVHLTPGAGAVTVWIPPGRPELAPPYDARVGPLLDRLLGPGTGRAQELLERFEAARPPAPDHYYLSLFGTRPESRGRGIGMALLTDDLARIDLEGRPAYLESTNAANLDRYRSVGFVDRAAFDLPDGGPTVTTMWRDAR